ncbi:MAG: hypothetical protein GXX94_05190 [Chloroflexi bacterium]|nr:hypothetical protein [Chloroflexota bacterium]
MTDWLDYAAPSAVSLAAALGIGSVLRYRAERYRRGTIRSAGRSRHYLLHVPPGYDESRPAPLVIALHSYGQWPSTQNAISRWNELADEQGFLVAYPVGSSFPIYWRVGGPVPSRTDPAPDIAFITNLIDHLGKAYAIDPARVYANGLSNGGGLCYVLACERPELFAAVGMIAGAYLHRCTERLDRRPVPAVVFHGTDDRIVPYQGGIAGMARVRFPSIPQWVERLARRNGIRTSPRPLPAQGDVQGLHYGSGATEILFYTVKGGGHTWPGGSGPLSARAGYRTPHIDATRVMWDFFRRHTLSDGHPSALPS